MGLLAAGRVVLQRFSYALFCISSCAVGAVLALSLPMQGDLQATLSTALLGAVALSFFGEARAHRWGKQARATLRSFQLSTSVIAALAMWLFSPEHSNAISAVHIAALTLLQAVGAPKAGTSAPPPGTPPHVPHSPASQSRRQSSVSPDRGCSMGGMAECVNIYVDVSNVRMPLRELRAALNIAGLYRVVKGGRPVVHSGAFGSYGRGSDGMALERQWKRAGFHSAVFSPLSHDNTEINVDELLAASAKDVIITGDGSTLVLVTGDANDNDGRPCSIWQTVQQALRHRIPVEIWTWRSSCSRRYIDLAEEQRIVLHFLDSHTEAILRPHRQRSCVVS
eukprot:TRINITY_DN4316_c1_g3_i1.p2 TRINITY_DN4316_c1_g3~~TRINITY_DN4316_c1_g3_i1.p2  ORF type:complete len:370 (+),score=78.67 TRINITY_DN4316_c1_g3_i1:101-1111(+)